MTNISKQIGEVIKRVEDKVVKSLDVASIEDATSKVSDIVVVGDGNLFKVLSKASSKSQGWMKSTKAMEVPSGVVVQVTTQQWDNVAEAITYVPGVKIEEDVNGGRKLVPIVFNVADCCGKAITESEG